jgi:hypothetical protein
MGKTLAAVVVALACGLMAPAQVFNEDFNRVTGTGGGVFLDGAGSGGLAEWDTGLLGENIFGSTLRYARATMAVHGNPSGGVNGTGAGEITVANVSHNLLNETFAEATGLGGGVFLTGDGSTPNQSANTPSWDTGVTIENAFFATYGGGTLNGTVSAQAALGGGYTDHAGQITVQGVTGPWYGGLAFALASGFPGGGGVLQNAGFDWNHWWPPPTGWQWTGNCTTGYCSVVIMHPQTYGYTMTPVSEPYIIKTWGESSVYQDVMATPGQTWELTCYSWHRAAEPLYGAKHLDMIMGFYDANGTLLADTTATIMTPETPQEQWILNTPIQMVAPAGTLNARATLKVTGTGGGSVYFDDVTFHAISGAPQFDYSAYSLTAKVRGIVNEGAGEHYGTYNLRIEDSRRNRLVFPSVGVASGEWVTVGGNLATAIEMDANSAPATGVFNPSSPTLKVILGYDGSWGTGGTIQIDDILFTNSFTYGSNWSNVMFWNNVLPPAVGDPRKLALWADLKGTVPGGNYQVRAEAYRNVPSLNESFSAVTGTGVTTQLVNPGGSSGQSGDWDNGLRNETAVAGSSNVVVTSPNGGMWARGVTTGGNPGGAAVIEGHEIAINDSTSNWWVQANFGYQMLASTNLANVTLTATMKGEWNSGLLEQAGRYQLRILDAAQDYIGFEVLANGSWQNVGGPLSTTNVLGKQGSGDGVFDPTNGPFTVAIYMKGTETDWNWGGKVTVDNLYITPAPQPYRQEVGRMWFNGVADGTFQRLGGALGDAGTTFPPVGGVLAVPVVYDWDRGITGEGAFYGTSSGALGPVSVQGCAGCGTNDTKGGRLDVTGISTNWFWAGAVWRDVPISLTDLSRVRFTADLKATWGATTGPIVLRAEDGSSHNLEFTCNADNQWHLVGGTLDTATAVGTPFNQERGRYNFTIIVYTHTQTEDPNATVWFDNVKIEYNHPTNGWQTVRLETFENCIGPTPGFLNDSGQPDSLAVAVSMEKGSATWGSGGTLTVDNVSFAPIPQSSDADTDIDLIDLAAVQRCYTGSGVTAGAPCNAYDADGDGDVDFMDVRAYLLFFGGPQ